MMSVSIINPVSDTSKWILTFISQGWRQSFLYANIDIEPLGNNNYSRTRPRTGNHSDFHSETAVNLVDKYPPIPGQFVLGCKNCSCFITRIMNRESNRLLFLVISFSSWKANKEKQSNVFLELRKFVKSWWWRPPHTKRG